MEDLTRQLTEFILQSIPLQAELVKVIAVDQDKLECTVKLGEVEIEGVNLTPTEKKTGLIQIPKIGSHIIVSTLHNEEGDYFVSMFSEVEEVIMILDNKERVKITSSLITFNEGKNGGLIKITELKTQLQKNTAILQSLLGVLTGPPVNEPGSGSPSVLQAVLKTALTGKQPGEFSNIENDKVKH